MKTKDNSKTYAKTGPGHPKPYKLPRQPRYDYVAPAHRLPRINPKAAHYKKFARIGEVAKWFRVHPDTIRRWDADGQLPADARSRAGQRLWHTEANQRVRTMKAIYDRIQRNKARREREELSTLSLARRQAIRRKEQMTDADAADFAMEVLAEADEVGQSAIIDGDQQPDSPSQLEISQEPDEPEATERVVKVPWME